MHRDNRVRARLHCAQSILVRPMRMHHVRLVVMHELLDELPLSPEHVEHALASADPIWPDMDAEISAPEHPWGIDCGIQSVHPHTMTSVKEAECKRRDWRAAESLWHLLARSQVWAEFLEGDGAR